MLSLSSAVEDRYHFQQCTEYPVFKTRKALNSERTD